MFINTYFIAIRNKFAALENSGGQWGHQKGMGQDYTEHHNFGVRKSKLLHIKASTPWFDEECSKLVAQRKQAELQ
jgi:hypothetical protein